MNQIKCKPYQCVTAQQKQLKEKDTFCANKKSQAQMKCNLLQMKEEDNQKSLQIQMCSHTYFNRKRLCEENHRQIKFVESGWLNDIKVSMMWVFSWKMCVNHSICLFSFMWLIDFSTQIKMFNYIHPFTIFINFVPMERERISTIHFKPINESELVNLSFQWWDFTLLENKKKIETTKSRKRKIKEKKLSDWIFQPSKSSSANYYQLGSLPFSPTEKSVVGKSAESCDNFIQKTFHNLIEKWRLFAIDPLEPKLSVRNWKIAEKTIPIEMHKLFGWTNWDWYVERVLVCIQSIDGN